MESSTPEKFRCTFPSCSSEFDSKALLRKHKSTKPEHDYCKICDEDFADWEGHLKHRIKSEKHIVCPICGEDFKSEGGQRRHVGQMHAAKQDIRCVGCGGQFTRAGSLMAHIEKKACPVISMEYVEKSRAHKELIAAFLSNPEAYVVPTTVGSVDGGVQIDRGFETEGDDTATIVSGSDGGALLPEVASSDWPKLDTVAYKDGGQQDLLTGLQTLELKEPVTTWGLRASDLLFPNEKENESSKSSEKSHGAAKKALGVPEPWNPDSETFDELIGFKSHLRSSTHLTERISCPGCLKIFNSTTALVQHCESASNRCKIREADDYNQALGVITGGVLDVDGYHDDGTIKYSAAQLSGLGGW
ncbi:MAG: hypothetical protein M1832_001892 [Thelocarpon impressellum]|nr:MAG: hypothetical protein M1832_001892 [Thelocarpon impressellum]